MSSNALTGFLGQLVEAGLTLAPGASGASLVAAGAGLAGWTASTALSALVESRTEKARSILVEELRAGTIPANYVASGDEAVAILYRYQRAALEGTARVNLRLMAQAVKGQMIATNLSADAFLHYADILSGLRRPEVVLLGTALRIFRNIPPGEKRVAPLASKLKVELVGKPMFPDQGALEAYCFSVTRFGLLSEGVGSEKAAFGGFPVVPTHILLDLAALIDIEAALEAEPE
jgi:hypothetical protein